MSVKTKPKAAIRTNGKKTATIPGPSIITMLVRVVGSRPFLSDAIPPHVLEGLKKKGTGEPQPKEPKRSEERQFKDALYEHPLGGYGWWASAFKDCMREGAKDVNGVAGTWIERNVLCYGEGGHALVRIDGEPKPHENFFRNQKTGGSGVAICAEFTEWEAVLQVEFNEQIISAEQILHCLNTGGFSTGIGHNRGNGYGRFQVKAVE